MIIYGRKSIALDAQQTETHDCQYCQSKQSVSFHFYQNCYHIYWIPLFPIGKYGFSSCAHCHQELYEVEMPEEQKRSFKKAYKELKTPLKYWIGLIVLGGLVLYSFIR